MYPGTIVLSGDAGRGVDIEAELLFVDANTSMLKLTATNTGSEAIAGARFVYGGTATNLTQAADDPAGVRLQGVDFALPNRNLPGPCFSPDVFTAGGIRFAPFVSGGAGGGAALKWDVTLVANGAFTASSPLGAPLEAGQSASTYAVVSSVTPTLPSATKGFGHLLGSAHAADGANMLGA